MGAGQAFAERTLADVATERDGIIQLASRMPRPDLQWWPLALDAAIEIAAGRTGAAAAIERAARRGRELNIEVASATAMVQQLLVMLLDGHLGSAAASLEGLASGTTAPSAVVAAYGLACAEAGAVDAVGDVADRLGGDPPSLLHGGIGWPQVAMCASEVAAAAEHGALASTLWDALEPYSGTGLALHAVGYLGAVDRYLGLLAFTLDEPVRALALLRAASVQERRRGAAPGTSGRRRPDQRQQPSRSAPRVLSGRRARVDVLALKRVRQHVVAPTTSTPGP